MPKASVRDVCVVTQPLSDAGEAATASLLDILSSITAVTLLTPHLPEDSKIPGRYTYVELSEVGTGSNVGIQAIRFLLNQLRMCRAIHGRDEGTVLFFGATSYLVPVVYSRLIGKTVVLQPRGDVPLTLRLHWERQVPGPIARALARSVWVLERLGFHAAHAIVTYTPSMVEQLGLEPFEGKVFTEGARYVDTDRFRPRIPFAERDAVVGFLGRLDEEKGVRELAQVARRLPEDVTFVFAGDGDLEGWLESELEEEIRSGGVEMTGWIDHAEVPDTLSRLRLLVMPSHPTEGLPTVILESLACGTPVLATPVAGVPDVVVDGRTGYHMTSREPEDIADAIAAVMDDPDLGAVSDRGRELIESTYTLDAAAGRYSAILRSIQTSAS